METIRDDNEEFANVEKILFDHVLLRLKDGTLNNASGISQIIKQNIFVDFWLSQEENWVATRLKLFVKVYISFPEEKLWENPYLNEKDKWIIKEGISHEIIFS